MEIALLGEALSEKSTPDVRQKALLLYQKLNSSISGWKSFSPLTEKSSFFEINPQLQFATLVLLQDHVKIHFSNCNEDEQSEFRTFAQNILLQFGNNLQMSSKLIKSKFASFISLLFVHDYPSNWKTFFADIMFLKDRGFDGIELFLLILKEINCELSDRQIARTDDELRRNTLIKDTMRDDCVSNLAQSWKEILKQFLYPTTAAEFNGGGNGDSCGGGLDSEDWRGSTIVTLCLEVVAGYIQWIEIGEVVNDEIVSLLLSLSFKKGTRRAAIETIEAVCCKGMLPDAKQSLIDSFYTILNSHNILQISNYDSENENDVEYLCSLAAFINSSLLQLVDIFKEFSRKDFTVSNNALVSIENKVQVLVDLVAHEDDDVSKAVLTSAKELLTIYRQIVITPERKTVIHSIMCGMVKKYKFEPDFDFNFSASQDGVAASDENEFFVYRQDLKHLFDSLAKLDNILVTEFVHNCFMSTIPQWRTRLSTSDVLSSFPDIELALSLLYLLGECLPHVSGNILSNESPCTPLVCDMLNVLMTSNVYEFDHGAVLLIYFETIVRYDKFFAFNTQHIPNILQAFTGGSGVLSKYTRVRGRCSYLFCRFIKVLKTAVQPHRDFLLNKIEKIIETVFVLDANAAAAANQFQSQYKQQQQQNCISNEDTQFLFEAAGLLIQMCPPENAPLMLSNVLRPINHRINQCVEQMIKLITSPLCSRDKMTAAAHKFSEFVSFASRLSKAFQTSQAVEASGCSGCLIETVEYVLRGLQVKEQEQQNNYSYESRRSESSSSGAAATVGANYTAIVYTAVKQYLHRMVICLQGEVILHYVKITMQSLLQTVTTAAAATCNQNPSLSTTTLLSSPSNSHLYNRYVDTAEGLIEFIPLVNQVVARYKKQSIEMLGGIFVPVLQVFSLVALQSTNQQQQPEVVNYEEYSNATEEETGMVELRSQLKRSFFTFINTILHNEAFPVIACQGQDVVWMVLMSVADGALHFPDPVTQKLCFTILKKFIEVANEASGASSCEEDIRKFTFTNVIPACFAVCCSPNFNTKDAQSNMALMEAGSALKYSYEKYGESVIDYLNTTYLPSQNIPQEKTIELTVAIRTFDAKRFRDFYKEWINKMLNQ